MLRKGYLLNRNIAGDVAVLRLYIIVIIYSLPVNTFSAGPLM